MKNPSMAYIIAMQHYQKACAKGQMRKVTFEQYTETGYKQVDTGYQTRKIVESIVIYQQGLLSSKDLSLNALRMLVQIGDELCLNNALWYYEPKTSQQRVALRALRAHGVLEKTEDPNIYFVDPTYVRRGSKPGVLALTTKELRDVARVGRENIRNLGTRDVELKELFALQRTLMP